MKFYRTDQFSRMALVIDSRGVTVEYQRPKVGGGYYTKDSQTFPWPWKKEN